MDARYRANGNTIAGDVGPRFPKPGSRAAVILGNDTILAARPCTPAQLTHACRAAGFDTVVPPSLGDELVAEAHLERLATCKARVAVACNCARVRSLLHAAPKGSIPTLVTVAAPPIAAARYLRLVYGNAILVTYVGDCPSANDPVIDVRFPPAGFFASLNRQGITLGSQPDVIPETESEGWRRYRSVAGGLPARRWIARAPVDRVVREVERADMDAARWASASRANILLDLADAAGCVCGAARTGIEEFEQPRSLTPIVVAPVGLDLTATPTRPANRSREIAAPRSPTGGAVDTARAPKALAAHSGEPGSRGLRLAAIPALVLVLMAALGFAAYAFASTNTRASATGAEGFRSPGGRASSAPDSVRAHPNDSGKATTLPPGPGATSIDSALRTSDTAGTIDSSRRAADTAGAPPGRRARRSPPPEVVPGWLPQGARRWPPSDTIRPVRPDSTRAPRSKPDTVPPA